ncbi:MAG: hypothetical protein IT381_05070 [Deltaproteobacteria bacterium]|nr:hypothetical protein [Deltaproteobacteria bacterium]
MITKTEGRYEVFTVIERNNKSYWSKLGRGYLNKDGSINVFLDALPVNGRLQIRVEVEDSKADKPQE